MDSKGVKSVTIATNSNSEEIADIDGRKVVKDEYDASMKSSERIYGSNDDRISTLPKVKRIFGLELYVYHGFYYNLRALKGLMCAQEHFIALSSDVVVASFPKSGTTWLKALTFAILYRTRYEKESHPLSSKVSHECVPCLELHVYNGGKPNPLLDNTLSPRIYSTHVPYSSLPSSIITNDCKIVYICRDPKDVIISTHHFIYKLALQREECKDEDKHDATGNFTVENAYDAFCKGTYAYGPYWDNVLSYWKASKEQKEKIYFLKYEDLKRDPQTLIRNLAQFLGQPFSLQEEEQGEVQNIVDLCSFEFLSRLEVNKIGLSPSNFTNDAFYRKGEVGDWKNHLTLDMAKQLDHITKQKFEAYGLTI